MRDSDSPREWTVLPLHFSFHLRPQWNSSVMYHRVFLHVHVVCKFFTNKLRAIIWGNTVVHGLRTFFQCIHNFVWCCFLHYLYFIVLTVTVHNKEHTLACRKQSKKVDHEMLPRTWRKFCSLHQFRFIRFNDNLTTVTSFANFFAVFV